MLVLVTLVIFTLLFDLVRLVVVRLLIDISDSPSVHVSSIVDVSLLAICTGFHVPQLHVGGVLSITVTSISLLVVLS